MLASSQLVVVWPSTWHDYELHFCVRKFLFSQCVVDTQNSLAKHVLEGCGKMRACGSPNLWITDQTADQCPQITHWKWPSM